MLALLVELVEITWTQLAASHWNSPAHAVDPKDKVICMPCSDVEEGINFETGCAS